MGLERRKKEEGQASSTHSSSGDPPALSQGLTVISRAGALVLGREVFICSVVNILGVTPPTMVDFSLPT